MTRLPVTVPPVIRPVEKADYAAWSGLWAGYNAFYNRTGPAAVSQPMSDLTWARFFDTYEPMFALVAVQDGALVGLAHCILHRNTTQAHPVCYLQDLYAAPAVRGQGVGRALIGAVYDRARADGCSRVYWQTHETNQAAMLLYDRIADRSGFIVYRHDL